MEFVGAVLSPILERLYPLLAESFGEVLNVRKDLEDITKNMKMIKCVLENAERRAVQDELVRLWMRELREVMFEMEDLIDDYKYERDRLANAPFYKKYKRCILRTIVSRRIKDIREKIDTIQKRKEQFNFDHDESVGKIYGVNKQALPKAWNVAGEKIEKDTEDLIKRITKVGDNEENISIIAITGMGGVGKTTLAQNVYFHLKGMATSFDRISWVSVTKDFNDIILLREILESINQNRRNDINSKVKLFEIHKEFLKSDNTSIRFFIVLDDIWKGDISDNLLYDVLHLGAPRSKILITTRDINIARKMKAGHVFQMDLLTESDALTLLYHNVFYNGSKGEIEKDKKLLYQISVSIVKKCNYLPLAIQAIGGVLRTKEKRENEWKKVLNSDLWTLNDFQDSVMASLYLSYFDMGPIMRECFLYLSLFPNKHLLCSSDVVHLWRAEGLVDGKKGEECFESLVECNLLQLHSDYYYDCYVMHDLVHSFARKLTEEVHVFQDGDGLEKLYGRRYSISNSKGPCSDTLNNSKWLRSLMFFNCSQMIHVPGKDIFKKLRHLRVLHLNGTGIVKLPDYITKLVQLRLLDLSETDIGSLPESIGGLLNLEYLGLVGCMSLNALPESLTKLKNLRILVTDMQGIKDVPKGLYRLTKLEALYDYAEIQELGPLMNLKFLGIKNVEGIDVVEAEKAKLKEKSNLRGLCFRCTTWDRNIAENHDIETQKKVLEALCPPPCVERLYFWNFSGPCMPRWLTSLCISALRNLIFLEIEGLKCCQQLPELGQLPNLEHLRILSAPCIKRIGLEFFYIDGRWQKDTRPFGKLKVLQLSDMEALEECEWTMDASARDKEATIMMPFPRLGELCVEECPKLISLWSCLRAASALTKLVIVDCLRLQVVPELPAVKTLTVVNCRRIQTAGPFPILEGVVWRSTSSIKRLPIWLGRLRGGETPSAPSLQKLYMEIGDSYLIRRLCRNDIGFDWPLIENIPTVSIDVMYGPSKGDFFAYTKSPFSYNARILKEYYGSDEVSYRCAPKVFTVCSHGMKHLQGTAAFNLFQFVSTTGCDLALAVFKMMVKSLQRRQKVHYDVWFIHLFLVYRRE